MLKITAKISDKKVSRLKKLRINVASEILKQLKQLRSQSLKIQAQDLKT